MDDDEDQPKVDFTFTPLEYDNYDVDQVILLKHGIRLG
jgi:hypothetical protein